MTGTTQITLDGLPASLQEEIINLVNTQNDQERDEAIKEICNRESVPIFFDSPTITSQDDPWKDFRNDYILKVESGNQFIEKLERIEKKFFESKYGSELYEKLKEKRVTYEEDMLKDIANQYTSSNSTSYTWTENDIKDRVKNLVDLNTILNEIKTDDTTENLTRSLDYIDRELENAYGNTYTDLRKVDYRNQEIDKITYSNTILNVIYLLIFILLVIAFLVEKKLTIRNFSILFLLALMPTFILPFLYGTSIKIIRYINNKYKPDVHGPKNAFLDENTDNYNSGAYDI